MLAQSSGASQVAKPTWIEKNFVVEPLARDVRFGVDSVVPHNGVFALGDDQLDEGRKRM
jgi:hypothetical protein